MDKAITRYRELLFMEESKSDKRRRVLERSQKTGSDSRGSDSSSSSSRDRRASLAPQERRPSLHASLIFPVDYRKQTPRSDDVPVSAPPVTLSAEMEALIALNRPPQYQSEVTVRMGEAFYRMFKFTRTHPAVITRCRV